MDKIKRTHNTIEKNLVFENKKQLHPGNGKSIVFKPTGLWYGINNEWMEWVVQKGLDWVHPYYYSIEINKSNILSLNSEQEIYRFNKKYKDYYHGIAFMRWNKVATDYAGVEIGNYFYSPPYRLELMWYYSLDCSSGCIWHEDGIKSIKKDK